MFEPSGFHTLIKNLSSLFFKKRMERLIQAIKDIPDKKTVTLITGKKIPVAVQVDVEPGGYFSGGEMGEELFRDYLRVAFKHLGGMTIQQFPVCDDESAIVPPSIIYGVRICNGYWYGQTQQEIEKQCRLNKKTGEMMEPEPNVSFMDFPV